jgi:hypothetical protein
MIPLLSRYVRKFRGGRGSDSLKYFDFKKSHGCRAGNGSNGGVEDSDGPARMPMRGILADCCATTITPVDLF